MRAFRFLPNFEISSEEISKKQKNFEMEKEGNFDISFFFLVYTVALGIQRFTKDSGCWGSFTRKIRERDLNKISIYELWCTCFEEEKESENDYSYTHLRYHKLRRCSSDRIIPFFFLEC